MFCSSNTRIFVCSIFLKRHDGFQLILHEGKSDHFTYNEAIFFNDIFYTFDFIILSDSNSNFNNFIEILSMKFFSMIRLDDCLMCLNISLIALKTSKSF